MASSEILLKIPVSSPIACSSCMAVAASMRSFWYTDRMEAVFRSVISDCSLASAVCIGGNLMSRSSGITPHADSAMIGNKRSIIGRRSFSRRPSM